MKPEVLAVLKSEIEQNFGRKVVSYRDCIHLVDDIYQKTELKVNVNTIRRFFGLVRTNYAPSPSTLSIFSKFCGFSSVDEMENISISTSNEKDVSKEEVYHYLVSLFKATPVSESFVPVMEHVVQETIFFLERNPSLINRFQREVANTAAGQFYYFERCVNMDRLNGFYGDGLKFYARSKNNAEAKLFANSLLVLCCWLTDDHLLLEKYMKEVLKINPDLAFPSHVISRFFAARIYYLSTKNDSADKVLPEISKYYNTIKEDLPETLQVSFVLVICEALALTNHKVEAVEWLKQAKNIPRQKNNHQVSLFNIWQHLLLQPDVSSKNRSYLFNNKKNKRIFFHPPQSNKKYLRLLQLVLKPEKKTTNELHSLIESTGYRKVLNVRPI